MNLADKELGTQDLYDKFTSSPSLGTICVEVKTVYNYYDCYIFSCLERGEIYRNFSFSGFQKKTRNFCYNASHDLQPQLIPSIYISILRQYDATVMDLITRRETETDPRCF